MKIAVYARKLDELEVATLRHLIALSKAKDIVLVFHENLQPLVSQDHLDSRYFSSAKDLKIAGVHFLITIGGDGTLLDSILYVRDTGTPVIGINTGRLGFLSHTVPEELESMFTELVKGDYYIDQRTLLETKTSGSTIGLIPYALNDMSVHKRDTSAMITVHTYLDDQFFNTYWADGLLVSTATGSTAYSLSCGGPILFPNTKGFVITPVAPHNLNVRPIIVSDESTVTLKIEGRGTNFLFALDSRNQAIDHSQTIEIKKAPFKLNMIRLAEKNFIRTLQDKLNWGKDNRNLDV